MYYLRIYTHTPYNSRQSVFNIYRIIETMFKGFQHCNVLSSPRGQLFVLKNNPPPQSRSRSARVAKIYLLL